MKDKTAYKALESIAEHISLSRLAKSIGKDKSWLYHKMKNDIVNGVEYRFNVSEYAILAEQLHKLAEDIHRCAEELDSVVQDANRTAGRYYTNENVFEYPLFKEWLKLIPELERTTILEPFAGECSIPKMLEQYGFKWKCYDIEGGDNVVKRDTISNFPKNHRVCITNPPYLAKNSATRRGLQYPDCEFDNIYKYCLKLMLDNCQYVAAIIPDSFIQSGLFTDRLYGVVSIPEKVFEDTEYPVCLAMFSPKKSADFEIWRGDTFLGSYSELSESALLEYRDERWVFNDENGNIGVICADGNKSRIRFVKGEDIDSEIKESSRFLVRVSGLPDDIDRDTFIERCNTILEQYRETTKDIFLNSFKGLRRDGMYRKRIPFKVIRSILTYALQKEQIFRD